MKRVTAALREVSLPPKLMNTRPSIHCTPYKVLACCCMCSRYLRDLPTTRFQNTHRA